MLVLSQHDHMLLSLSIFWVSNQSIYTYKYVFVFFLSSFLSFIHFSRMGDFVSQTRTILFRLCSPNKITYRHIWICYDCVCVYLVSVNVFLFVCVSLIGSNLSSTGAMPSSPVRSFRLISSICSCTEMKRVKKKKRNEANLDIRPFYIALNCS